MKRAATQLFKRQSKNRAFFKIIHELSPPADPRARQRSENRPQGQLECANQVAQGDGQAWN